MQISRRGILGGFAALAALPILTPEITEAIKDIDPGLVATPNTETAYARVAFQIGNHRFITGQANHTIKPHGVFQALGHSAVLSFEIRNDLPFEPTGGKSFAMELSGMPSQFVPYICDAHIGMQKIAFWLIVQDHSLACPAAMISALEFRHSFRGETTVWIEARKLFEVNNA